MTPTSASPVRWWQASFRQKITACCFKLQLNKFTVAFLLDSLFFKKGFVTASVVTVLFRVDKVAFCFLKLL